jgi:transposase
MVELAWMWLRHQPGSSLSAWFRERVGTLEGRIRRITIVAVARKLLITLWRYLEGVLPKTSAPRSEHLAAPPVPKDSDADLSE